MSLIYNANDKFLDSKHDKSIKHWEIIFITENQIWKKKLKLLTAFRHKNVSLPKHFSLYGLKNLFNVKQQYQYKYNNSEHDVKQF